MESAETEIIDVIRTLPPLVAVVVWDVVSGNITKATKDAANATTDDEFKKYDIVRCVAAASLDYPPINEAQVLIEEMLEKGIE